MVSNKPFDRNQYEGNAIRNSFKLLLGSQFFKIFFNVNFETLGTISRVDHSYLSYSILHWKHFDHLLFFWHERKLDLIRSCRATFIIVFISMSKFLRCSVELWFSGTCMNECLIPARSKFSEFNVSNEWTQLIWFECWRTLYPFLPFITKKRQFQ